MGGFGEKIRPIDSIKGILAAYPFSIGLFRELLQNSDDAGATVQVRHPKMHIAMILLLTAGWCRRLSWTIESTPISRSWIRN